MACSLGAVMAQDYPSDRMEVIVADGLSTDETPEIIRSMQARYPNLQMLDNAGRIVSTGLNIATARARGELVVRVDGHCEIASDYVRRCVEHLQDENVDGVGGPIETIGETPMARIIAVAMSSPFGVGNSAFRTVRGKTMWVDTIAFPGYRRSIIERAGPYDEELVRNQDDEYNYRLRKLGARLLLAADIHSRYYSRSSLRCLWRQYFQYGYWKVRVMQKHPRQMRLRQFVPPLFVAALVIGALLAMFSQVAAYLLGAVMTMYLVLNGAASVHAAVKAGPHTGRRRFVILPIVYLVLHISYGLGFLVGNVRFWNRWGDKRTQVHMSPLPLHTTA